MTEQTKIESELVDPGPTIKVGGKPQLPPSTSELMREFYRETLHNECIGD